MPTTGRQNPGAIPPVKMTGNGHATPAIMSIDIGLKGVRVPKFFVTLTSGGNGYSRVSHISRKRLLDCGAISWQSEDAWLTSRSKLRSDGQYQVGVRWSGWVIREGSCKGSVECSSIGRIINIVQAKYELLWRLPQTQIHAQILLEHLGQTIELTASTSNSPFNHNVIEVTFCGFFEGER
ncbi:peptide-N4-(N-acetyl-beta-D-glucosaminyl) asparaginase amidase N, partial [Aureobasidium melanogenum]